MTFSDKANQWIEENRHVEKHGLLLAQLNDLGQDSGETILQLTDEQKPRFVKDQLTYEPDDGSLTTSDLRRIRKMAAPMLCKGQVLRHRSLLEESDD